MAIRFEVRQGIEETKKGHIAMLVYTSTDESRAIKEARKISKTARFPVYIYRIQKDRIAVYENGRKAKR